MYLPLVLRVLHPKCVPCKPRRPWLQPPTGTGCECSVGEGRSGLCFGHRKSSFLLTVLTLPRVGCPEQRGRWGWLARSRVMAMGGEWMSPASSPVEAGSGHVLWEAQCFLLLQRGRLEALHFSTRPGILLLIGDVSYSQRCRIMRKSFCLHSGL